MRRPTRPFPSLAWACAWARLAAVPRTPRILRRGPEAVLPTSSHGSGRSRPASGERGRLFARARDRSGRRCREKARKLVEKFGRACQVDTARLCAGIRPGGGGSSSASGSTRRAFLLLQAELDWFAGPARSSPPSSGRARPTPSASARASLRGPAAPGVPAGERGQPVGGCNAGRPSPARWKREHRRHRPRRDPRGPGQGIPEILQGIDAVAFSRSQILFPARQLRRAGSKPTPAACSSTPVRVRRPAPVRAPAEGPGADRVPVHDEVRRSPGGRHHTAFAWNVSFRRGRPLPLAHAAVAHGRAASPGLLLALVADLRLALGPGQGLLAHDAAHLDAVPSRAAAIPRPTCCCWSQSWSPPFRPGGSWPCTPGWGWNLDDDPPSCRSMKGVAACSSTQKSVSISAWYRPRYSEARLPDLQVLARRRTLANFYDW